MNTVTKLSTAATAPRKAFVNPFFPRFVTRPDGAVITVNDHHQMSAHMGAEYGPDAKLVLTLPPEPQFQIAPKPEPPPFTPEPIITNRFPIPVADLSPELAEDFEAADTDPSEIEPEDRGSEKVDGPDRRRRRKAVK